MLVLGIETSTSQTTVALGTEQGILAGTQLSTGKANHEGVGPTLRDPPLCADPASRRGDRRSGIARRGGILGPVLPALDLRRHRRQARRGVLRLLPPGPRR